MVFVLEISAGPADRILFLTGPPPDEGTVLELCSGEARERVLVVQAMPLSMQVERCFGGPVGDRMPSERCGHWPRGTRLRMPLEFTAIPGGLWECSLCWTPVTRRGRHTEWHEELKVGV